jgi:hypothetical protein
MSIEVEDVQTVAENREMANLLNRAFKKVFTREDTTNIPEPKGITLEAPWRQSSSLCEKCAEKYATSDQRRPLD